MRTILFLLEEESAKFVLQGLLPRLLPHEVVPEYLVFEGKSDLEANIERKIRGWQRPDTRFLVLRDQDATDCHATKQRLSALVPDSQRDLTLVRIACRELESWLLGDWRAVGEAFGQPTLANNQRKRPYKNPDQLRIPVAELRKFCRSTRSATEPDGSALAWIRSAICRRVSAPSVRRCTGWRTERRVQPRSTRGRSRRSSAVTS